MDGGSLCVKFQNKMMVTLMAPFCLADDLSNYIGLYECCGVTYSCSVQEPFDCILLSRYK